MSHNAKRIIGTGLFAVLSLSSLTAFAGLQVSGAQLREANGQNFVMRGVNLPHAWYADRTSQSLKDISATGANTVRVVLSNGKIWRRTPASEVAEIIRVAKEEDLITVLEVHDTTGFGEQTAATLSEAVDYWVSLRDVLVGQEDYVIINIGNEPYGNGQPASAWLNGHSDAIARLRREGFEHVLMVDAANWGQDWQGIMRSNAPTLMNLDPRRRLVFSVHMYEVYPNDSAVNGYFGAFRSMNLPLVVGEFAADHFGAFVDANAIMARAQQYGIGYLGWSWSGNSSNLSSLDVVQNFDPGRLTAWGSRLINGQNGIRATSRKASIFATGGGCTATPIVPNLRVFTSAWGAWQRASSVTINRGQGVQLSPEPTSGGSWSWSGCGISGTAREQTLSPTQTCTATATYANACGTRSSQNFQITVNGTPPSGGGGRCAMTISGEWNEGYTARVTIRNTTSSPINGWQVGWSFGDGSRVRDHWNAQLTGGNPYTAAPVGWNRTIQPGQQVEFGFNVNKGRPGTPAAPVAVTGGVCN